MSSYFIRHACTERKKVTQQNSSSPTKGGQAFDSLLLNFNSNDSLQISKIENELSYPRVSHIKSFFYGDIISCANSCCAVSLIFYNYSNQ